MICHRLMLIAPLFLLVIGLGACQVPTLAVPTPTPDLAVALQDWRTSPHANTYDEGKGPNTFCARCHSPRNWDPASKVDAMPNCVSCKFSTDPVIRIAKSNPPVSRANWQSIGCEVCHKTEQGVVTAQIAWLNTATHQYESVGNATALCEKCHTDTDTIRHKRDLGTSAHKNFTCVNCHNPHSTIASCTSPACHPNTTTAFKAIPGHDPAHASVTCAACHDASGLAIGTDNGKWIILRTTELLGRSTMAPFQSHNLQRAVNCDKCHGPNNRWGLGPVTK